MSRPTSRFEGILLFVPFLLAAEKNHPFVQKMIVRGAGFYVGGPEAPPLCADCAACVAPCADALASVLRRSAPSRLVAASPPPLLGFRGGVCPPSVSRVAPIPRRRVWSGPPPDWRGRSPRRGTPRTPCGTGSGPASPATSAPGPRPQGSRRPPSLSWRSLAAHRHQTVGLHPGPLQESTAQESCPCRRRRRRRRRAPRSWLPTA